MRQIFYVQGSARCAAGCEYFVQIPVFRHRWFLAYTWKIYAQTQSWFLLKPAAFPINCYYYSAQEFFQKYTRMTTIFHFGRVITYTSLWAYRLTKELTSKRIDTFVTIVHTVWQNLCFAVSRQVTFCLLSRPLETRIVIRGDTASVKSGGRRYLQLEPSDGSSTRGQ